MTEADQKAKYTLLAGLLVLYCLAFAGLLTKQPQVTIQSDLFSRWYPTKMLLTEGRSLYDPQNRLDVNAYKEVQPDPIESTFFYPAHLILLLAPLTALPYPASFFIWVFLIQILYLAGIWMLCREFSWPAGVNARTVFLLLALFFIPNFQNTIWAQYNTINLFFLVCVYLALIRRKDALAGLLALGLTFKPQTMMMTFIFLGLWALVNRRWRFLLSFGITCLAAWALTEAFEPMWIRSFLHGLQEYNAHHQPASILGLLGPAAQPLSIGLSAAALVLFILQRRSQPGEPGFDGCLAMSWFAWWLIIPVLGMIQLVMLPIGVVFILPHLERSFASLYRGSVILLLLIYAIGVLGFVYGLSDPERYGLHILLAEGAYKVALSLVVLALSLFLALPVAQRVQSIAARGSDPGGN